MIVYSNKYFSYTKTSTKTSTNKSIPLELLSNFGGPQNKVSYFFYLFCCYLLVRFYLQTMGDCIYKPWVAALCVATRAAGTSWVCFPTNKQLATTTYDDYHKRLYKFMVLKLFPKYCKNEVHFLWTL